MDKFALILAAIQTELDLCMKILREEFSSDIQLINDVSDHILARPGKMLRPAIVIASAKICGCTDMQAAARVAAVLEMMHNATLVHDDYIDQSDTRRGSLTVHKKWSREIAILMGDYLYAKALNIIVKEKNFELNETLGNATVKMCEAELYQLQMNFDPEITESEYLTLISGKTAELIAAGCKLGAILSNSDHAIKQAMWEFGYRIGVAFQIIDDLFDYRSKEGKVGKPVGHDLTEGKVTLPLIHALKTAPAHEGEPYKQSIKSRQITPQIWNEIQKFVKTYKGADYAYQKAQQLVTEALELAEQFPSSKFKTTMINLAEFILNRSS